MHQLTIVASSSNPFSRFAKRAQNGRKKFEEPRNASVKNLNNDLKKIAKEEVEFSKSVLKQIIPVEIFIDKNAKGIRKLIPLNITLMNEEAPDVRTDTLNTPIDYENNDAVMTD